MIKHPTTRAERRRLTLVKETERLKKPTRKQALDEVLQKELEDEFKDSLLEQSPSQEL